MTTNEDEFNDPLVIKKNQKLYSKFCNHNQTQLLEVDPNKCFPWQFHNRSLNTLSLKSCKDLVDSIKKIGQAEPILVRKVTLDPNYDFEIIFGVRRWFACRQIANQKLLAYVTDVDDKTCAILMHAENTHRKDITKFEKACSFLQQMNSGLFKNQLELAQAVGFTQGFISKLLKAARLLDYEWIHPLFQAKQELSIRYAYQLARHLEDPKANNLIKERFELLLQEYQKASTTISATDVMKQLINFAESKTCGKHTPMMNQSDLPSIRYVAKKPGTLTIEIDNSSRQLNQEEIQTTISNLIKKHLN